MKNYHKEIVLSKLVEYLDYKDIKVKKIGNARMINCPVCGTKSSAQLLPDNSAVDCMECEEFYTLCYLVNYLDFDEEGEENEILEHLIKVLNLDIKTDKEEKEIEKLLDFYEELGFDLVQLVPNGKAPVERNWPNNNHKKKSEWERWLANKANIGMKTGKISGYTSIDIDRKEIPEDVKPLLGDTLVLNTPNGWQYLYKYTEDLPKTRIDEYNIDIENDGGQIVIPPAKTKNKDGDLVARNWVEIKEPIEIPEKLKELLKSKSSGPTQTYSEQICEDISKEIYSKPLIGEGDGRNDLFVRLYGMYRKFLNKKQCAQALRILDKVICDPRLGSELDRTVFKSGEKYIDFEEGEIQHKILKHLREVKKATQSNIELSVMDGFTKGESKTRVGKALRNLQLEEKISEIGNGTYEIIEEMEWDDTISDTGKPVDFKLPYFYDYTTINEGDLIIIGGLPGAGKTHLAMNLVERLVDQNIKPHYVYNETGNRWGPIARRLGMKDGDFERAWCANPRKLRLRPNTVTIFDWVLPRDFARTDLLYEALSSQLASKGGVLICFAQLKENKDGSTRFFAQDQIKQFPSLAVKYLYEEEGDGTFTKFESYKVREPKRRGSKFEIPCKYNWDTYKVERIEDLKKGEK